MIDRPYILENMLPILLQFILYFRPGQIFWINTVFSSAALYSGVLLIGNTLFSIVEIEKMIGYNKRVMNYTYILKCRDGSLYTGWTTHLEERVRTHNEGHGAKYTRSRRPVELVYYEVFETKEEALRRERAIKQLSRRKKMELIAEQGEVTYE